MTTYIKTGITLDRIKLWLNKQHESQVLSIEDFDHVSDCLMAIVRWYDDGLPTGSFTRAVLQNDLMEAVGRADDVNIRLLPLYCRFLYNEMPATYQLKVKEMLKR